MSDCPLREFQSKDVATDKEHQNINSKTTTFNTTIDVDAFSTAIGWAVQTICLQQLSELYIGDATELFLFLTNIYRLMEKVGYNPADVDINLYPDGKTIDISMPNEMSSLVDLLRAFATKFPIFSAQWVCSFELYGLNSYELLSLPIAESE